MAPVSNNWVCSDRRANLGKNVERSGPRAVSRGHGPNGEQADYRGAERIEVPQPSLRAGDPCPACGEGRFAGHPCLRAARGVTRPRGVGFSVLRPTTAPYFLCAPNNNWRARRMEVFLSATRPVT